MSCRTSWECNKDMCSEAHALEENHHHRLISCSWMHHDKARQVLASKSALCCTATQLGMSPRRTGQKLCALGRQCCGHSSAAEQMPECWMRGAGIWSHLGRLQTMQDNAMCTTSRYDSPVTHDSYTSESERSSPSSHLPPLPHTPTTPKPPPPPFSPSSGDSSSCLTSCGICSRSMACSLLM